MAGFDRSMVLLLGEGGPTTEQVLLDAIGAKSRDDALLELAHCFANDQRLGDLLPVIYDAIWRGGCLSG